jgi:hypothetical protein
MALRLPKLDKALNIIDLRDGRPTPAFQRWWQSAAVRADTGADDAAGKVSKLSATIYPQTVLTTPPTQGELQAMADALALISEKLRQ